MKVLRYSLVAAAAILAAACGDKVQVVGPNNNAITSVQVSPASATISVGQSVTLTAAVNAAPGVTPVVTWSVGGGSSAVTVSATGVVLGVSASPGVAVCALATSGTSSLTDCATVIVQPPTAVVPAVLQIASITTQAGLNNPAPIAPAATGGQLNVSVNLNPGTEQMDSVVVLMNGIPAATTTFTSAQAAALRSAANAAGASQALQQTLVFPINTAAYATGGCATQVAPCGKATFGNGPAVFSAIGYGKQGGTAATNSTTQGGQNYLIANPDAWILTQTLGTGFNSATSAAGFNYVGGPTASVSVTAVPVSYSGLTVASANVNYGNAACDASGSGQRVQPLTAPVAPSLAWTATFARTGTGTAHAADVNNYEFNAAVCTGANAAGGEGASIASVLYTNNTTGATGFAAGSPIPVARLDNRAPGAPTLIQNPRVRQNGWINMQVGLNAFNTGSAATANNVVVAGAPDAGVGGTTAWVRVGAPGAGNIVDPVTAMTATNAAVIGTGALAPSLTNNSICGVWTTRDALSNESALPANGTVCSPTAGASNTALASTDMLFGVDIAPPTIAFSGGLAANARINTATVAAEFQVTVSDTGTVGNSGMLSGSSVVGNVIIHNSNTSANVCFIGTGASCAATSVNAAPAYPLVPTTTVTASTTVGYYLYTSVSQDAAGNQSGMVAKVIAFDPAANVPALTTALFNVPLTGPSVVFNANASDNFDLWKATYTLAYAGAGLAGPVLYPSVVLNTFPTTATAATFPLVNSNVAAGFTLNGFMRQVELVTGNAPVAVGGQFKPSGLTGIAVDQANNPSAAANTAIPGASVTTGVSYLNGVTYPAPLLINSWAITNVAKSVSTGATTPATNPLSIALTVVANGPTATFNPPFTSVQFYAVVAGNLEQIGSTTSFSTVDNGAPMGRSHTYSFTWTPGTTSPVSGTAWVLGAQNIFAIGVNANGDALVSPVNANITLTNQ